MSRRNYPRIRIPKPGGIIVKWAALPGEEPDLCYAMGDRVPRCDGRLIMGAFTQRRYCPLDKKYGQSLMAELESRGYDVATLQFSIKKKTDSSEYVWKDIGLMG